MTASNRPICTICDKPVTLKTSKVDELGKAVHVGMLSAEGQLATGHQSASAPPQLGRSIRDCEYRL
jgi:hypothetical protein